MTLLHPWALFAGLAVGLPLLIHWLTRPRPVRLPLSTVRFVLEAVRQRRARYRLRDLLLLLLRVAAVALLVFAFCRPLIGPTPLVATEAAGDTTRVVLLDQSQSLGAVSHGVAGFDRARAVAVRYLGDHSGTRANLILAAARPRAVAERLTSSLSPLRDELGTATSLPQGLDLPAAINMASDLLASGKTPNRELVIVSDFQRSNWASVDFTPLPSGTKIQLESVAPVEAPANLAVLRVWADGRPQQGRELQLNVEVGNFSTTPRDVQIELTAGRALASLHGPCPPGVKTTLSTHFVPTETGWQTGKARLIGLEDALPADNQRAFVLNVRPAATYALVTREPSTPSPTSSHFLERALVPAIPPPPGDANIAASSSRERVKRVDPSTLDRDAIASADLIVLDHPGKLSQPAVNVLASLLRRGRPVLYIAAEPVDATNLKLLSDAAGADLKMPVEFLPPPAAATRHDLFLADVRRKDAPFVTFGEALPAAIGPLRFGGGLASKPLPGGIAEDVLAVYGDRSACLVTASCGAGTLGVLNADLNDSNLVASPVFVPLIEELVSRLLGRRGTQDAAPSGQAFAADLPGEAGAAAGLKVIALKPGSEASSAPADGGGAITDDDSGFVRWRWTTAGAPGVYAVRRDRDTLFAAATAIPASEADLTPLDPAVLKGRLAGDREVAFRSGTDDGERHDNLWAWAMVACAGCMLIELLTLRMFRT